MDYRSARGIRNQSLKTLIIDRTLDGQGFGKSISSSIKDKTKAKLTGLKEKFDPMNISRAIGGRLGAYAYGKIAGRSQEDIDYFTGKRNSAITAIKNNPLISKVSDGENRPVRRGEGLSTIMARIFNLLKKQILDEKKQNEITANFEEEREFERELRHKELLDALGHLGGGTATKQDKGKGFLERIIEIVKKMLAAVFLKLKPLLKFLKTMIKSIAMGKDLSTLRSIASLALANPLTFLGAAAIGAVVVTTREVEERQAAVRINPYKAEYLSDPYAMIQRGEASNNTEAGALNAQKIGKQKPRDLVESIMTNPLFTEAEKKQELSVQNLQQVTDWLARTQGNQRAQFQGEVTNRAGKLVILSGGVGENLVVPNTNPRSPKYVPLAAAAPVILNTEPIDSTQVQIAPGGAEGNQMSRQAETSSVSVRPVTAQSPGSTAVAVDRSGSGTSTIGTSNSSGGATTATREFGSASGTVGLPPPIGESMPLRSVDKPAGTDLNLVPNQSGKSSFSPTMPAASRAAQSFLQNQNLYASLNLNDSGGSTKPTIIDASKNVVKTGTGGIDFAVSTPVRTTNETLVAILKANRRFSGPPIAMA
jgi:hypothetical protein